MPHRLIIKNSIANFAGNATNKLVRILLVPLQINYLGEQAFGLIGFYAVLGAIVAFLDFGLTQTANREVARLKTDLVHGKQEIRNLIRTFEVLYWFVAIIIGITMLFSSPWLAQKWIKAPGLDPKSVVLSLNIMGILLAARWPVSLYQGILLGLEKQVIKNAVGITIELINGVGSIIILIFKPSIELFFLWQLMVGVIEITGYVCFCWAMVKEKEAKTPLFQISIIKEVWQYAFGVNTISVIGSFFGRADSLILSKLFTIDVLGYYSLAQRVTPLMGMLPTSVLQASAPSLVAYYANGNKEELSRLYHRQTKLISFSVTGLSIILAVYSYPILRLWTQSEEVARISSLPFSIISIAAVLESMINSVNQLSLSSGFIKPLILVNIITGVVVASGTLLLAPSLGIMGAVAAWFLSRVVMYLSYPLLVHQKILKNEIRNWFISDTLPFLLVGGLCGFLSHYFYQLFFNGYENYYWIPMIMVTGLVYVVIVIILNLVPDLRSIYIYRKSII